MARAQTEPIWKLMGFLFRAHPWHGVRIGEEAPDVVTAYIEMLPTDTVKYEIDKVSGYLQIDRPQKYSNVCPALYGLVPQTYCAERVARFCEEKTGRTGLVGDGDPLDICVLTEKPIMHADILLQAIPVGGFRMLDGNEVDDKIIAVLQGDAMYEGWRDISQCPASLIDRLRHYFLTYKEAPGSTGEPVVEITHVYGRDEAHEVIRRSQQDYEGRFGTLEDLLTVALRG
jgi:inorganic pyrophosphatase